MKSSPIYPNYETSDYGGNEFDPHRDFSLFLEEAREHARQANPQTSLPNPEEGVKGRLEEAEKKKSWRSSLFKWWKADKKSKPSAEPSNGSQVSNARRGHVSGPINGSGTRVISTRHSHQNSGPVTSLFNPTRRVENEMPYMCLHKLNNTQAASEAYGPVYLVT